MRIITRLSKKVIMATGFTPSQLIVGSFVSAGLEEWVMKPVVQEIEKKCGEMKSKRNGNKKNKRRRGMERK